MSNRRRAHHQRKPGPGEAYCNQPAVVLDRTQPGAVDEARTLSHDSLIAQLGGRRRSGIWWTQHYPSKALAVLDEMYPQHELTARESQIVTQMRLHLQNPASLLVFAWAIGEVPEGVAL